MEFQHELTPECIIIRLQTPAFATKDRIIRCLVQVQLVLRVLAEVEGGGGGRGGVPYMYNLKLTNLKCLRSTVMEMKKYVICGCCSES